MIKKTAFILVFSCFFPIIGLYSQPKATFQIVGGYSMPLGDYHGTFGSTYAQFTFGGNPDSSSYFMKSGINYGLIGKFPINRKTLPLSVTGSLLINGFGQNRQYANDSGTGYLEVDLKQNITTIGFGLEYSTFGKKTKLNPYLGLEFMINIFSGQFTSYESVSNITTLYSLISTVRAGLQARAGIDYVLHNNVGITLGAMYSTANLIGKSSGKDVTPNYYLNDAEHEDQGSVFPARSITYLQFFGGFSFYFGR